MARALAIISQSQIELHGVKWTIQGLNGIDMLKVSEHSVQAEGGGTVIKVDGLQVLIKHGLKGWEGFLDAEGNEVKFLPGNMQANMDRIPLDVIKDLAMAILNASDIGVDDEKKS